LPISHVLSLVPVFIDKRPQAIYYLLKVHKQTVYALLEGSIYWGLLSINTGTRLKTGILIKESAGPFKRNTYFSVYPRDLIAILPFT